jgi:hypothetical protein
MKNAKRALAALSVIAIILSAGCASTKVKVVEMENKGTSVGVSTPGWVKTYTQYGISRLQSQSEYRDRYCVVGEETGINRQFVLAWADNFSAQQRIGAMLRTTIASEYNAKVQGSARSAGINEVALGSTVYQQQIDDVLNTLVNVSYSGAQREADWWSLLRRYDPDVKDSYRDEYTGYVLYTIPKAMLNQQVAYALETAVNSDSALYDVTIEIARQIMINGIESWGEE